MFSSAVSATPVDIINTVPTWSNVQGGSGTQLNNTNGFFTDVRWGIGTSEGFFGTPGPKSGLGFDPVNPPTATQSPNIAFKLGDLRHYNNPINSGTAAQSVDLSLRTSIAGAVPPTESFSFRFFIDETPNSGDSEDCSFPSITPCADKITFLNLDLKSAFSIGSINYTLALIGFRNDTDPLDQFMTSFISQEGGTNTVALWGQLTEAQVPTEVLEPGSLALIGLALAGLAVTRRRRSVS